MACGIFVAGCGSTLKNSWTNFRAYYNTYYNAEKNFRAGLKKIEEQPFTMDPDEPVRIHSAPVNVGSSDFQKTIDKGARILRKFPTSHLVDDALLLIGKSYYYRQEFYSALQKFEELRNASASPKMEQLAIIWKGRTQLDLNTYAEGVSFLEQELARYPNNWSQERKAVIHALAGEHHAMLENWEQAAEHLSIAVSEIKDDKLLGRTFFLYGQVLERLERYGEAYFTFGRSSENFAGFEYQFWARYKQADVARKENNLDLAISIYEALQRDDKYSDRRAELTFEIARTLEKKGEIEKAEQRYKQLLHDDRTIQERSLKADIYYRLGKIYSDQYNDYQIAAAYFDSSSSLDEAPRAAENGPNADALADAFESYTNLKSTINRADSLLRLSTLTEAQLDSVLENIRARKRQELLKTEELEQKNILVNQNIEEVEDLAAAASSTFGFLSYRNADIVNRSQTNFRIIWGDRPLVDNWRRMEVVRRSMVRNQSPDSDDERAVGGIEENPLTAEINLDEIPQNQVEKNRLKMEKANAWYALGNLFFLNLDLPDSARHHYKKVIENGVDDELRARAMYSLFELFTTTDSRDSLEYWGQKILREYPDSRFARRVNSRLNGAPESRLEPDSSQKLIHEFEEIRSSSAPGKAEKLRKLALENKSSELAPHIYYQAIENYIRKAKAQTDSGKTSAGSASDSVQTLPAENTLSFDGARWDSVRSTIQEFESTFPDAEQRTKVAKLRELVMQSKSFTPLPTCEDWGISLEVQPDMNEFLSSVEYPEKLDEMTISGEVRYSFVVTSRGEAESFELMSRKTSLGVEEALEKAFRRTLQFAPVQLENPPEKIRCEISFPIQH